MQESEEPASLAVTSWLVGGLIIPLAPLLSVMFLRRVNGDSFTWMVLWCSEVPTYGLQLSLILLAKTTQMVDDKRHSALARSAASLIRVLVGILTISMLFGFHSFCRDATSDKISDLARWNWMWVMIAIAALMTIVALLFAAWRRMLGAEVRS